MGKLIALGTQLPTPVGSLASPRVKDRPRRSSEAQHLALRSTPPPPPHRAHPRDQQAFCVLYRLLNNPDTSRISEGWWIRYQVKALSDGRKSMAFTIVRGEFCGLIFLDRV
jgi:hypothetical protein